MLQQYVVAGILEGSRSMKLGIYGSGGAGREVKEIAELRNEWDEIIFIDDTVPSGEFKGIKRLPFNELVQNYSVDEIELVIAIGEPADKSILMDRVKKAGYMLARVIHPLASISPSATIGEGVIMKAGTIVSADAVLEDNVSMEEYAVVGHDSVVRKNSQISAFVFIAGNCIIGEGTFIGLSVPVKERITIGNNVVIGMGSVVVNDIPDDVIAIGNPARPMKKKGISKVFG